MPPADEIVQRQLRRFLVVAAALCGVAGLLALLWLGRVLAGRAGFALDLEWMEGGTLVHALRLAEGKRIYAPPSVDFIPFLYTPLYPAVLAVLARAVPLSYALGRAVSIAAFAGSLAVVFYLGARQMTGFVMRARVAATAVGLGGAGAIAAGFVFTGTFYDLVRADSLVLLLQVTALALAYQGEELPSAALAGLCIALAFFTKQTASLIGIAIGLPLLLANWRRGLLYGLCAAVALAAGLVFLNRSGDGWFWTYVFKLHQSHAFHWRRAFFETPWRLMRFLWPVLLALGITVQALRLADRFQRRDLILLSAALGGLVSGCIGFGTQWAFDNAFIPSLFFPVLASSVLGARLVGLLIQAPRQIPSLLTGAALLLLAGQAGKSGPPDRAALVPAAADHAAAERFLDRVRALPGDGFIPFHPFYSVLAGKPPFVHRMGVMDVGAAIGRPRGLDEAIAQQRFPWIILDWKSRPGEWPGLEARYHVVETFRDGVDATRSFSGAETSPRTLLFPSFDPPARSPGAIALGEFETGRWEGFSTDGDAWGPGPVPALEFGYGAFVADSGRAGKDRTGVLRSAPFKLTRKRLKFLLGSDEGPGLRVFLLVGGEAVRQVVPRNKAEQIDWDVAAFAGQDAVLIAEDRGPTAALRLDDLVAVDP